MASNIFQNEFFQCPSYIWGSMVVGLYIAAMIFALSLLDNILGTKEEVPLMFAGEPVLVDGVQQTVERGKFAAFGKGIGAFINVGWFLYVVFRFFKRSPNCTRAAYKTNQWKSPLSMEGPKTE